MADDDDDLAGSIDRLATIESLGNAVSSLNALAQAKQSSALRNEMAQLRQAEEARQRAEAERAEREYLGAHCPWCHTSLTGTPVVCAACTRAVFWLRLPLDEAVLELMSSNLHTFKEVYRELLGVSVVFDQNQKLVHVPLCYQEHFGEAQTRVQILDEKLLSYINYFCRVVERRKNAVAKCPKCETEVFERALVQSKKGTDRICPPCSASSPLVGILTGFASFVGLVLLCAGVLSFTKVGNVFVSPALETTGGYFVGIVTVAWVAWAVIFSNRIEEQKKSSKIEREELSAAAALPDDCLSFGAKTMNGLVNLLDLRTKSLEQLLKRIDGATVPRQVSFDVGDASLAVLNGVDAAGTNSPTSGENAPMTPIVKVAETRLALAREPSEFTAVGKPKPLNADSACTRVVALALVVMKTATAAAARECADNLAQQLVFIEPDELLKSTRSISSDIKANTFQFVFEQVCERLRAESPNAKSKYKEIAQTIASLVPKDSKVNATNATGPKVIRALCRVLNS